MTGSPATRGIAVEQAVVYGLLTALGLGALVMALGYGFFLEESRVGPGLVPGVVGGLIVLIAGWELIATLRGHRTSHDHGLAEVVAAADAGHHPGRCLPGARRPGGAPSGDAPRCPRTTDPWRPRPPGRRPGLDDVDIFGRTPKERGRQLVTVFAALVVAVPAGPGPGLPRARSSSCRCSSPRSWSGAAGSRPLIVSFLAVAVVYGVFVGFLDVPLPTG